MANEMIEEYSHTFGELIPVVASQIKRKVTNKQGFQFLWGNVKIGQTVKYDSTGTNLQYLDRYMKITKIVEHIYREEKHFFFSGKIYAEGESIFMKKLELLFFLIILVNPKVDLRICNLLNTVQTIHYKVIVRDVTVFPFKNKFMIVDF